MVNMKRHGAMNRIYRLVWNQVTQTWVAVPEVSRGLSKSMCSKLLGVAAIGLLGVFSVQAGGPTGSQVIHGTGTVTQSSGITTINQSSQNLSLNWKSFNVAPTETVKFIQPSASAIAVNRIDDVNGSQILGRLTANGQVFLINPNGVLFGANAQVNVGALVASTLDLSDSTLNSGSTKFSGSALNSNASVVNMGLINANGVAGTGGFIALLGNTVSNQGNLSAPQGSVAMGAGSAVTLRFQNNSLIKMTVDQSAFKALAENSGVIQADGGVVLMTAGAKNSLLASVVNNTGVIEARTVENHDGTIILLGGQLAGQTNVAGTLDSSAPHGGNGGLIETSAASVKISDTAKISTAATSGQGGVWLVDPTDFTIAASGADMTGSTLSNLLSTNSIVVIQTSNGSQGVHGDITVNDAVNWSTNNKLILDAYRNININKTITATGGSGQLALLYGQGAGAENNTAAYKINAPINLQNGQNFTTTLGSDGITKVFTVIGGLGAAASTTGADLQGIGGNLSGNFALGNTIDATPTKTWNAGAGFTPIAGFTGTLDGLGHTVNGLVINLPGTASVGLIGTAGTGALIQNIGLLGGTTKGGAGTGALVGTGGTSTIYNSFATGNVMGAASTGGLVGTMTTGSIRNSYATGHVSNVSAASVGGLLGSGTTSNIENSYATGNVTGGAGAGGLIGALTSGNVSNSYAAGDVKGGAGTGGLVGTITTGNISNTYATGSVTGDAGTGGLVGVGTTGIITNSYATGLLSGIGAGRGGLIGSTSASHVGSFWDAGSTGMSTSTGGTAVGMTTSQLQTQANFTSATSANKNSNPSWDMTNTWIMYEGLSMPLLRKFLTPITVTATNVEKTYNGLAYAGNSGASFVSSTYSSNLAPQNLDGTLVYGSSALGASNAGTYSIGLSGLYSNQQGYLINYVPGTLTVAPTTVSISGVRFYDGTRDASANIFTLSGLVSGQDLFLSGMGSMTNQNVGTAKSVSMDTLALRNGNTGLSNNYTFVGGTQLVRINPAEITISAIDRSKTYDGTLSVDGTGIVTSGSLYGSDALSSSGLVFTDKNVGKDTKTVTANGVSILDGNSGTNYKITYVSNTSSTINPKVLTVTAVADDKIYDGKTTANVQLLDDRVAGDLLTLSLKPSPNGNSTSGTFITVTNADGSSTQIVSGSSGANFADKNFGTGKAVFVVGIQVSGKDTANYVANTTAFSSANISPKPISVVATGQNKVYDGTLTDAVILSSTGLIRGDNLTLTGSGAFSTTSAGTGKSVAVTAIQASGGDAGNYSLINTTASASANITPKIITVLASGIDRVYDGTTNDTVTLSSTGVLAQDLELVQFSSNAAVFSSKNVGVLKQVSVSGIRTIGSQANNYQLKSSNATTRATVTAAPIMVTATGIDKVYDGTNKGSVIFNRSGVFNGDVVSIGSSSMLFSNKNAGNAKLITVAGIGLSGKDAGNYILSNSSNPNASTTAFADISTKLINVTAKGGSMVYNGGLNATVSLTSTGKVKGDDLGFSDVTALLDTKNIGASKTVNVTGITAQGSDAANYSLINTTATAKMTVTAKPISVVATGVNKVSDGNTNASVTLDSLGVLADDILSFALTSAKFTNSTVGVNKAITVLGVKAVGADAANYKILSSKVTTQASITSP